MRTERRLTWLIFTVCALLVIDGMGWVTWQLINLERREHAAQHNAQRQEAVRLALWRMDGLLSPVIAAEASRPYFHYRSFYPAERAYTRMWEEVLPGEVLVASPLLAGPGEYIRLHFESTPEGWLTSPQAPGAELRDRVESVTLSLPDILTVERALIELTAILRGGPPTGDGPSDLAAPMTLSRGLPTDRQLAKAQAELQAFAQGERDRSAPAEVGPGVADLGVSVAEDAEGERSLAEYQARQQNALNAQEFVDTASRARERDQTIGEFVLEADGVREPSVELESRVAGLAFASGAAEAVHTGRFAPVWRTNPVSDEPELLFVRAVTVNGRESTQGVWIDWPVLRAALLASIGDLLPTAELMPVRRQPAGVGGATVANAAQHGGQLLAGVPAVLVAGPIDVATITGLTPTRTVLLVAWLAVLAAVVAIGLVLRASLALSDRRGRFVSAVTHELRTPLTTFCLYSQMLADGMVKDESRQREYLGTLKRESEHLATIVENVLAFARVGSKPAKVAPHAVMKLLDAATPSLGEIASQAEMQFEVDAEGLERAHIAADQSSIERILGNLIDNACKYAQEAEDRRVTLRVRLVGSGVEFRVRDRGPGIPSRERRRVFSPFARARVNAADGSSGLGLGLALARSVARSLGGELRLARPTGPGAEFVLWLPGADSPVDREAGGADTG